MKKEIDTIIFDLDGTLLNTLDDLHACFNEAIAKFGYPIRSKEEIRSFVGNGIKKAIERALPYTVNEDELNNIVDYFRGYYKAHMLEFTKPYDGIIEILKELRAKNYKIGVVSNKYDTAVKGLCQNYFKDLVMVAVGEGDGVRKKPEIDGILKAVKELNSDLERSIYVGDSDVDIMTAQNAGIECISALWGFRDEEFLRQRGGKFFAKKPKDIINIIEKKLYLG